MKHTIEIELEPWPDYGDKFTIDEFVQEVRNGNFINYDGSGYYATEQGMSRIPAIPSEIGYTRWGMKGFTHVAWFNK